MDYKLIPSAQGVMRKALIAETEALFTRCSLAQKTMFVRVWPMWPATTMEELKSAYELVRRTVIRNEADPTRLQGRTD